MPPHREKLPVLVAESPSVAVHGTGAETATPVLYQIGDDSDLPTVVLVDPLSTGVLLQGRVFALGYRVIVVWSDRSQEASREKHFANSGYSKEDFAGSIVHRADSPIEETVNQVLAITTNIVAVMCGSEHGVLLEDALAEGLCAALGVSHIKSSGMHSRQTKVDKHAQANTIRKAGLAAIRETLAHSEEDVEKFLETVAGNPDQSFVVKPQTGAGSVGVTFCASADAVRAAYAKIIAGEHKAHCKHKYKHYTKAGVLLQEYLKGTEYIVNSVIRNGEIRTTAMFKYGELTGACGGRTSMLFFFHVANSSVFLLSSDNR